MNLDKYRWALSPSSESSFFSLLLYYISEMLPWCCAYLRFLVPHMLLPLYISTPSPPQGWTPGHLQLPLPQTSLTHKFCQPTLQGRVSSVWRQCCFLEWLWLLQPTVLSSSPLFMREEVIRKLWNPQERLQTKTPPATPTHISQMNIQHSVRIWGIFSNLGTLEFRNTAVEKINK